MIHDVTDLEVYNLSLKLLKEAYVLLRKVHPSEKDTIYQIKRAAKSVPANIAEGFVEKNKCSSFKMAIWSTLIHRNTDLLIH